jgi:alpha-tubulin suppressor-like RCC1 family protein
MRMKSIVLVIAPVVVLSSASIARAQQAAAGESHTVVLTDGGVVWAWGTNANGQLGLGHTTSKTLPTEVTSLARARATVIPRKRREKLY